LPGAPFSLLIFCAPLFLTLFFSARLLLLTFGFVLLAENTAVRAIDRLLFFRSGRDLRLRAPVRRVGSLSLDEVGL